LRSDPRAARMRAVPNVTIVVPCFNEEQRLDTGQFRAFSAPGHRVDFCFVNDGSTDGTLRVLEALRAEDPERFPVVNLERNSGKAEAVRRGIVAASERGADIVGFWDADLATPLAEIPGFLDVFATRPEIEMVFGARVRLLGREISRNPSRHYFGRVGATLISQTLGLAVYDTQCGAKLFRNRDGLRQVFAKPFLSRWIFDVEIIARYVQLWGRERASKSIYELPIRVWRDVHGSKVKSTDFLRALRDLRKIRKAYRQPATGN
jgi:dolichyl-phosphate beta-glucosyltransferase